MDAERWRQIDQIFQDLLEHEPAKRALLLAEACAGNPSLQSEIEALLRSHEQVDSFLKPPAPELTGSVLGSYEVKALIGTGGMGRVYRAWDSKLKRHVAIKVLPEEFSGNAERVSRFQREAHVLASLNHPNIAHIYGLEQSGTTPCIVMELVEGETLQARIKQGAIPVNEALAIAKQIAEALAAAHEKGVIHRDLKPRNVMLAADGRAKVLDFGLAKVYDTTPSSAASSNSPTVASSATTQAGMILGTAAYMSPEQASGKPVDKRADVWAFGVVMWEMLTGEQLFKGETVSHIAASILKDKPDLMRVPFKVQRLLRLCLEKNPQERLRDIGDAMVLLEETPAATARGSKMGWIVAAALSTAIAAAGLWTWLKPEAVAKPALVTHFIAATPQGLGGINVVISPDGSHIAFISARQIFLRKMNDLEAKAVAGTENAFVFTFSPDGQWIAFITAPRPGSTELLIEKVPLGGGAPQTLASFPANLGTGPLSWEADGTILLSGTTVRRLPEAGGEATTITKADAAKGERNFVSPTLLPGGKYILATIVTTTKSAADLRVVAIEVKTGEKKTLLEGVGETKFAPTGANSETGHLFWSRLGSLFAAPFNATTLQVGPSVPVLEGLAGLGGQNTANVSQTGTLVYVGSITSAPNQTLVWVDRQGTEQPLPMPVLRIVGNPQLSPNGRSVAVSTFDPARFNGSLIWLHDLSRGATTRLTPENVSGGPVWTPDGARLIYTSSKSMSTAGWLASIAADGSGQPLRLTEETEPATGLAVSPDGKTLLGVRSGFLTFRGRESWMLALDGAGTSQARPQPFLDDRFSRGFFQFSPDGKWVAYDSDETGRSEIFVLPYPGPGPKSQISIDGGTNPRWNQNGHELFFRNGNKMMAAAIETGAIFQVSKPKALFQKQSQGYDVASDGRRFLMLNVSAEDQGLRADLHVIVNWFDELRNRVPLGKGFR